VRVAAGALRALASRGDGPTLFGTLRAPLTPRVAVATTPGEGHSDAGPESRARTAR